VSVNDPHINPRDEDMSDYKTIVILGCWFEGGDLDCNGKFKYKVTITGDPDDQSDVKLVEVTCDHQSWFAQPAFDAYEELAKEIAESRYDDERKWR
jgi:hypothetical protein